MIKKTLAPLWSIILILTHSQSMPSRAEELLANGNFESGTLAGWTVVDQAGGAGTFYLDNPGTTTPAGGFSTSANPAGGSFYAVSDTSGPGAHALLQSFTITSPFESVILTFQMFVNNQAGTAHLNPAGLNYTVSPNQHARVDLLTGSSSAFDTGSGVIQNFYLGSDAGSNPHGYSSYSFDITPYVSLSGTYQIRFAQVDNQSQLNMGVDNVSVTKSVPEPASTALFLSGIALLVLRRSRTGPSV